MLYIEIKNDSFLRFTILSVGLEGIGQTFAVLRYLEKGFLWPLLNFWAKLGTPDLETRTNIFCPRICIL